MGGDLLANKNIQRWQLPSLAIKKIGVIAFLASYKGSVLVHCSVFASKKNVVYIEPCRIASLTFQEFYCSRVFSLSFFLCYNLNKRRKGFASKGKGYCHLLHLCGWLQISLHNGHNNVKGYTRLSWWLPSQKCCLKNIFWHDKPWR